VTRFKQHKAAVHYAHPFVDLIWSEINSRKLSHTDIAKASGVDARTLRRWRDGETMPAVDLLENVLDTLGFDLIVRPKNPLKECAL
jgi:transcriptional regulator with XRE-family HTH domain